MKRRKKKKRKKTAGQERRGERSWKKKMRESERNKRERACNEQERQRYHRRGILRKEPRCSRKRLTRYYPTVLIFANAVMTMRLSGETDVPSSKMSTIDGKMVRTETQTHRGSLSSSLLSRSLPATTMIRRELSTLRHDAHTHHTHDGIYTLLRYRP